jgi:sodium/bile acid cotransporter 7
VMFAGPSVSLIVLPLMIFHQIQLMACAALARRYASASAPASEPAGLRLPAFGEGRS